MPIYRLTFFYSLGTQGWTELYYREAPSARLATELGGASGIIAWLRPRPAGASLDAVRAQDVAGYRRVYLRLLGFSGRNPNSPDVTQTAARMWIPWDGGGRHLYLRGIADNLVKRSPSGLDTPHPELTKAFRDINKRIFELDFRGQSQVQSHPWGAVWQFGPDPDFAQFTRVQVASDFQAKVGSYVYFGGKKEISTPFTRSYLVVAFEPGRLTIAHPWPPGLASEPARQPCRVRISEFRYPKLGEAVFRAFGKHATGGRYHLLSWAPLDPAISPINPCGRGVDMGRFTYRTLMRTSRDDKDVTVAVQWYKVTNDNPVTVPYEHPFASRNWELLNDYPTTLGEVYQPRILSRAIPVELDGVGLCGSASAWLNGAGVLDAPRPINPFTGSPCCCGPGVLFVRGGMAGTGSAQVYPVLHVRGGMAAGGRTEAPANVLHVRGGMAAGGQIGTAAAPSTVVSVRGGFAAGGRATLAAQGVVSVRGGLALGGPARDDVLLVRGGMAAGGRTEAPANVLLARGGMAAGGRGVIEPSLPPTDWEGCAFCPEGTYHSWRLTVEGGTEDWEKHNGVYDLIPITEHDNPEGLEETLCYWLALDVIDPIAPYRWQFRILDGGAFVHVSQVDQHFGYAAYSVARDDCFGPWTLNLANVIANPDTVMGDPPPTVYLEPLFGEVSPLPGWRKRKALRYGSVFPGENLTGFPKLFIIAADSDIAAELAAGGGIAITGPDGETPVPFGLYPSSDPSSGDLILRAKLDLLTAAMTGDAMAYLYFDADQSTTQDKAGTVDSYYGFLPLEEDPSGSAPQIFDWVSESNIGTATVGMDSGDLVDGQIGQALEFNGNNQRITTPWTDLGFAAGTIEWWARPTSDSGSRTMWGHVIPGGSAPFLGAQKYQDGNLYVGWESPERRVIVTASGNFVVNTWQHYVFVWNSSGSWLYRNGALIGSNGAGPTVGAVGTPFEIGLFEYASNIGFIGQLDEFVVANTDRTADYAGYRYQDDANNADTFTLGDLEEFT